MDLKNFVTRALAAAVYVGLIFGSLLLGAASFGLLCALILIIALDEYFQLIKKFNIRSAELLTIISSALGFGLIVFYKLEMISSKFLILIPFGFIAIMIREIFKKSKSPIHNIAFTIFGFIYIFIPLSALFLIAFYDKYVWTFEFQGTFLIAFFLLVWANDTGAYLFGSAFGKHKLMERISPKKTIEGGLGGLALTVFGGWVVSLFATQVGLLDWIFIAVLIVIFGSIGDLFESLLKRKAEVKDSGKLIPGHGGMLDRFDSILFAAPVVFIYLTLAGY